MSLLSSRIALRYFISAKSHGAVNVISFISVAGVAVATAAIVIVLSVFNGFSNLTRSRFSMVDPDVLVTARNGKVFSNADSICEVLLGVDGVAAVAPTLTDRGLVIGSDNAEVGVVFKGIDSRYTGVTNLDSITEYHLYRSEGDTLAGASVAVGVASQLGLTPGETVELYTLRRIGRINPANPSTAFFSAQLGLDRILRVDQLEFDADHIFVPLDVARSLLQYADGDASAIEIALAPDASTRAVTNRIKKALGAGYDVLDRDMQNVEAYRMIAVEKWVTFTMLIFILLIAAFNIISTLSLMVIEKRDNMATLRFLGAGVGFVKSVFAKMGFIITVVGGVCGIILGVGLALAQQWGGFIKLNGDSAALTISEYPVRVEICDICAVFALVIVIALAASFSTLIFTKKQSD